MLGVKHWYFFRDFGDLRDTSMNEEQIYRYCHTKCTYVVYLEEQSEREILQNTFSRDHLHNFNKKILNL